MFVIIGSRRISLSETIFTPCNVFYHCFLSASLAFRRKGGRNCETGEQGKQGSLVSTWRRCDKVTKDLYFHCRGELIQTSWQRWPWRNDWLSLTGHLSTHFVMMHPVHQYVIRTSTRLARLGQSVRTMQVGSQARTLADSQGAFSHHFPRL